MLADYLARLKRREAVVRYAQGPVDQATNLWLRGMLSSHPLLNRIHTTGLGSQYKNSIFDILDALHRGEDPAQFNVNGASYAEQLRGLLNQSTGMPPPEMAAMGELAEQERHRLGLPATHPLHQPFIDPLLSSHSDEASRQALHGILQSSRDAHDAFFSLPEDFHRIHPAMGGAAHNLIRHALSTGHLPTLLALLHMTHTSGRRSVGSRGGLRDRFGAQFPLQQAISEGLAHRQLSSHALGGGHESDSRPTETLPEDYYALKRSGRPC